MLFERRFHQPTTYAALRTLIDGNAVFYLATAPEFFGTIVDMLGDGGLLDEDVGFRHVVVEKPFGHDLASAKALNTQILARAQERQIFRIDHFLARKPSRTLWSRVSATY